ncbi:hypothetical protein GJR88_03518 [Dietzia sp. DQ12-45-1b]|nr:hypothetical protein GJR88_03518 [Dietzia sp. DQ12-45-1b]
MAAMLGLVWHSAWLVLEGEPHSDRLRFELRELRLREAELVRRLGNSEERDDFDD